MKILSVVGARPQFIKAAQVSKQIRKYFQEILVHTGQHYDYGMSPIFFEELDIPNPDYNLGIGSGKQGEQTGKMIMEMEKVILKEEPDLVLVYGDTNSTLSGALAAVKLSVPIGHVEAGLRSYNRRMPEEINRLITDHLADILFCPTETAVKNLKKEGITKGVFNVGDVMYDALLVNIKIATQRSRILKDINLKPKTYHYATIHRAENTDKKENLKNILEGFSKSKELIIFPIHPRTKKMIDEFKLKISDNIKIVDPLGYLDNLVLMTNAKKILTDSGGVQKEAYFLKIPCITLRAETEWVETVRAGWNILAGTSPEKIVSNINNFSPKSSQRDYFGEGNAAVNIAKKIQFAAEEPKNED